MNNQMIYLIHFNGKGRIIEMQPTDTSEIYGQIQARFAKTAGGSENDYADMIRLYDDQIEYGVYYDWGLAGCHGAWFTLIAFPNTTKEQIKDAKTKIRRDRDVVSMTVLRIKKMI